MRNLLYTLLMLFLLSSSARGQGWSLWVPDGSGSLKPASGRTVGFHDSDDSHIYTFDMTSDASAARTISWAFGDAARTITLSGNPTLSDWFNQDIQTTASPTFVGATFSDNVDIDANNKAIRFGAAQDASIYYDGTDLILSSAEVGTGAIKVLSSDQSDYFKLIHNNTDAWTYWSDGNLKFQTDEGTNTNSTIEVRGKGAGIGYFQCYDQDDQEYLQFYASNGSGYFSVRGSSPGALQLQRDADGDVYLFGGAASGETNDLRIYGYRAGDVQRSLQITVGVDQADTASLDGVSNVYIDSNVGVKEATPAYPLQVAGAISALEKSADPTQPAEGECAIWMSDGTGKGDDGDVCIASTAGGTTNWSILFDHSAGSAW